MPVEQFVVGPMGNNAYLVYDEEAEEALLIDPSIRSQHILDWLGERDLTLRYVVNTHGHMDHVYGNALFVERTGAQLLIHRNDEPMLENLAAQGGWMGLRPTASPVPDVYLTDGQEIRVGSLTLRVLETPGHTPGSVCLHHDGLLFTGDTLFQGSIGRFDFPGGSRRDIITSIVTRLLVLPEETQVLPGHGPRTTIGEERRHNPFVGEGTPERARWMSGP